MMQGIIFLDRDGVMNKKAPEHQYITSVNEFEYIPGILEFIKRIKDLGFIVCVITNQQGVGKGIMTENDLHSIHDTIQNDLASHGVLIDAFYYCPHLKSDNCHCRKPKTGLLEQAVHDFSFKDKERMFLIGDSDSDIECANNFSIQSIQVETDRTFDFYETILNILRKITQNYNDDKR